MASPPIKDIEARCTLFAAALLRELGDHPELPELLLMLDKIDGLIFSSDIEAACMALRKHAHREPRDADA